MSAEFEPSIHIYYLYLVAITPNRGNLFMYCMKNLKYADRAYSILSKTDVHTAHLLVQTVRPCKSKLVI